jgi:hypothetical protein
MLPDTRESLRLAKKSLCKTGMKNCLGKVRAGEHLDNPADTQRSFLEASG